MFGTLGLLTASYVGIGAAQTGGAGTVRPSGFHQSAASRAKQDPQVRFLGTPPPPFPLTLSLAQQALCTPVVSCLHAFAIVHNEKVSVSVTPLVHFPSEYRPKLKLV